MRYDDPSTSNKALHLFIVPCHGFVFNKDGVLVAFLPVGG